MLYHGFQIPRNRWKHSACGLVLSSVSRYLEPVIKHSPSFLTYYLNDWVWQSNSQKKLEQLNLIERGRSCRSWHTLDQIWKLYRKIVLFATCFLFLGCLTKYSGCDCSVCLSARIYTSTRLHFHCHITTLLMPLIVFLVSVVASQFISHYLVPLLTKNRLFPSNWRPCNVKNSVE